MVLLLLTPTKQCDLPRSHWKSSSQEGIKLAKQFQNTTFYEVSSYLDVHVRDVFLGGLAQHWHRKKAQVTLQIPAFKK